MFYNKFLKTNKKLLDSSYTNKQTLVDCKKIIPNGDGRCPWNISTKSVQTLK